MTNLNSYMKILFNALKSDNFSNSNRNLNIFLERAFLIFYKFDKLPILTGLIPPV